MNRGDETKMIAASNLTLAYYQTLPAHSIGPANWSEPEQLISEVFDTYQKFLDRLNSPAEFIGVLPETGDAR